jgi:hypothetical protein
MFRQQMRLLNVESTKKRAQIFYKNALFYNKLNGFALQKAQQREKGVVFEKIFEKISNEFKILI